MNDLLPTYIPVHELDLIITGKNKGFLTISQICFALYAV